MSEPVDRTEKFSRLAKLSLILALGLLVLLIVMSFIAGGLGWTAAAVGAMVMIMWTVFFYAQIGLSQQSKTSVEAVANRVERLESLLEDLARSSRKQSDLAALSDQAKALLFRDREMDAFREAIHEDLMRQDYTSASTLIDTVENRLGHLEEAARLRAELAASQKATVQEKIDQALARVEKIVEQKDWSRALRVAQRLGRAFPTDSRATALMDKVESARTRHKRDLLQEYGEAVRKNDVDRGIELLKELDTYLAPQEAAALQESARGVFRAKLHMLGVQFAIRVTEGQWKEAVTTGREIVQEFPNTRMAQEVRTKMESLLARAGTAVAASQ